MSVASTNREFAALRDEIVDEIHKHRAEADKLGDDFRKLRKDVYDATSLLQRARERVQEDAEREQRNRTGCWGSGGPGSLIASKHEFIELAKSAGKATMEMDALFDRQAARASIIDSGGLGYGTAGILERDRLRYAPMARRRLFLTELLPSRRVESGEVDFIQQVTAATAGAQVESSPKHETELAWTPKTARIATIATWIRASRQALEDSRELAQIIDNELIYSVLKTTEEHLLAGDGIGPNIQGIIGQSTAFDTGRIQVNDTRADILRRGIGQLEADDEAPDFIVIHPDDSELIDTTKDGEDAGKGAYIIGSPLGQVGVRTLWNKFLVVSTAIAAGSWLIGSTEQAQILERAPTRLMLSMHDESNFTRNLITLLCEARVGLVVYRPAAFLKGSFATASP